ncbi:hypothetical protein SLA2020_047780 [Shorea laevis]
MWKEFKRFGRAIQIYIASKKDKWGRPFGFVRYLDVKNPREMELNLSKIKVGERRIQANLARHNEENGTVGLKRREIMTIAAQSKRVEANVAVKSYADAVKGKERAAEGTGLLGKRWTPKKNGRVNDEQSELEEVLECQPSAENEEWLKNCYVGQIHRLEALTELKDKIMIEGFFSINITPMGGNLVLIHSEDEGEVMNLVKEGSEWIGEWFKDIKPWSPKEVAKERSTWLQCFGVPLNIWNEELFKRIGIRYGSVIEVDRLTVLRKRLDVGRVCISTAAMENIIKTLKIKVGNVFYQVRICEEARMENVYNPNFLSEDEGESSDELWVEESSLNHSDSEWEDMRIEEDSQKSPTKKVITEGETSTGRDEVCLQAGEFEMPMEEARKTAGTDGTDGEAEIVANSITDSKEGTAGSRQLTKEGPSPEGYTKEVEVSREQRENEVEREKMFATDSASNNANQMAHFGPFQERAEHEETNGLGFNSFSPNGPAIGSMDTVDNDCSNSYKDHSRVLLEAKGQTVSKKTNGSESEVGDSSEDSRNEVGEFWAGLASEAELYQLRMEENRQRKVRKSRGDRNKKAKGKKKQIVAGHMRSDPERTKEGGDQVENRAEISQKGNSNSESGTNNCNMRFSLRSWEEEASELWAVGKKLGLVRRGNEEEIIKRLGEMEKRDRTALAKKNQKARVDREGKEILK